MQSILSLCEEIFLQKLAVEKKRAQSLASPHADLASPAQSRRSSLLDVDTVLWFCILSWFKCPVDKKQITLLSEICGFTFVFTFLPVRQNLKRSNTRTL